MKTMLVLWFALCLSASAALPGPAWLASAKVGAGGCAACTSSTDTRFAGVGDHNNDFNNFGNVWWAWKFTLASEKCITGLTWSCNENPAANAVTMEVYTDVASSPGSIVGAGFTSTIDPIPVPFVEHREFLFASTQTLAAGTYWVVVKVVSASIVFGCYLPNGSDEKYSTDSGANWSGTPDAYYSSIGILGCDP